MMFRFMLPFLLVAVVVVLVVGAVLLVRLSGAGGGGPGPDDPREILKRRYAAGEIDEDEYLRRMSGLSQEW